MVECFQHFFDELGIDKDHLEREIFAILRSLTRLEQRAAGLSELDLEFISDGLETFINGTVQFVK